jgi:rhomboid protease GluP
MGDVPTYRVRETLLSRKPRTFSREVATLTVMAVLWISLLAWRNGEALLPTLAASSDGVFNQQEYWRLLTAVAVHSDLEHFFSNVVFLGLFSYLLYGYFGCWVFPALGLALAALTNYLSLLTYPPQVSLVGASGLVYVMAGFWLSMYLVVERTLSVGKRLLRAVGIALVVLVPTTLQEEVSYRAHAIGFGLGALSAFVYFRSRRASIRAAEVVEREDPFD